MAGRASLGGVAVLLVALLPGPGAGQVQYEGIPVPPYEFYEALLAYVDQKDFESLPRALKFTSPLLKYLDRTYGEGMEERLNVAVRDHDAAKLMDSLRRVVYLDLVSHLRSAVAGGEVVRQDRGQMAFINYTFLASEVRRRSPERDRVIRRAFRNLLAGSAGGGPAVTGTIEKEIADGMGWVRQ